MIFLIIRNESLFYVKRNGMPDMEKQLPVRQQYDYSHIAFSMR
jgi:hypothetical protein